MDAPFIGSTVEGPDAQGIVTTWGVISSHPVTVAHGVADGWVAWLMAPGRPMLCVGSRGFEPPEGGGEPPYRVVAKSPLAP